MSINRKFDDKTVIDKINSKRQFALFDPERSRLEYEELPFYRHFTLVRATAFSTIPPVTMEYLLSDEGEIIAMDGTRNPIIENNDKGGLVLDSDTVVAYAGFVLGATQTEDGPLRLTEVFSEDLFTDVPTDEQRRLLRSLVRKVIVKEKGKTFILDAIILFGNAVYRADVEVKPNGQMEITGEEKLASGLPTRPIFLE